MAGNILGRGQVVRSQERPYSLSLGHGRLLEEKLSPGVVGRQSRQEEQQEQRLRGERKRLSGCRGYGYWELAWAVVIVFVLPEARQRWEGVFVQFPPFPSPLLSQTESGTCFCLGSL